ncbi:chemotaxis protein [Agrobacterium tumefaciens]|uniref:Chemotaxis protein n=1 Tax=Agrobacterium tumefaciens TaxID=358 RepID=A0A0D0KTW8_AGRTU|nr:chemotaxis protein [Agrobacterium tumefaciens]
MKNLPILTKFLIIMAISTVFCLGVAIYTSEQIRSIDTAYSGLIDEEAAASIAISRANRSMQGMRATISEILAATNPDTLKRTKAEFDDVRARFVGFMDTSIKALPSKKSLVDLKAEGLRVVDVVCNEIITAGMATTDAAASQRLQDKYFETCQPAIASFAAAMTQNANQIIGATEEESTQLSENSASIVMSSMAGIVLGMGVVLALGIFLIRSSISNPIRQLASTMGVLANGNLSAVVEGTDRRDEVGDMAKAVQVFKDNGLKARDLETQAASQRDMSEAERARAVEADRQRAAEMAEATSGLAEGLQHLASGNLGFELSQPFAADFEGLRSNFNAAVGQLRNTLSSVAEATRAIDSGSRELSASANDLSKRTEQQAAALEQTAAALDEITVNVKNSSQRTEEAREMAVDANKSARQSGDVVANAVNAMQRIETSSSQISNIIGVIDEIAFQTNLLALNAGVEAARAGEAGKGFAVVAQEVRELAQRSAQAAKEIKELIRTSAGEVENGVKLVTATGDALKVIDDHVAAINGQLDAISTSAREQSVGLTEVNTAVNQMDQTTQQNAAMVEQATAASSTLANEAEKLRQLVSRFQLSSGSKGSVSAGYGAGPLAVASANHAPAPSPARKLSRAVGGGSSAAAAQSWEEF